MLTDVPSESLLILHQTVFYTSTNLNFKCIASGENQKITVFKMNTGQQIRVHSGREIAMS